VKLYLALVQYLVLTDYGKANMSLPSVYAKAYLLLIAIRAIFQLDGERIFLDYKGLAAFQQQSGLSWATWHQWLAVLIEQKYPVGIFMLHVVLLFLDAGNSDSCRLSESGDPIRIRVVAHRQSCPCLP
jgi:hypothetical protein